MLCLVVVVAAVADDHDNVAALNGDGVVYLKENRHCIHHPHPRIL